MVKNPEAKNLDKYEYFYRRNVYPHSGIDRIAQYTLDGELHILSDGEYDPILTNDIIKKSRLEMTLNSLLRTSFIKGDGYARIIRDKLGKIVRFHHFPVKDVEILIEDGKIESYEVEYSSGKIEYPEMEIIHIQNNKQEASPYGLSKLIGIEDIIERHREIYSQWPDALRGLMPSFDFVGNLKFLEQEKYFYSHHFGIPIGVLTAQIHDIKQHEQEMKEFDKKNSSYREILRKEITNKILKPEKEKSKSKEDLGIGWMRTYKPTLEILKEANELFKAQKISIDDFTDRVQKRDYYV